MTNEHTSPERKEKFTQYNPYAREIEQTTIGDMRDRGGPEHVAMLAIAYELAQLRATIKFGGK